MSRIYDLDRMGVLLFDFHMANSSHTRLYRKMSDFCRRFHLAAHRRAGWNRAVGKRLIPRIICGQQTAVKQLISLD
jgi:hypothetical protein